MNRISKRAFLALLLAVLFAVPAGVILWSHRETTAYYENRTLAERPALTWQSLWDGTFATAFESWFSDHAPGRTTLLEADTAVQMKVLHRPVVNDIVLSADGVLVPFLSYDEYTEQDYAGPAASIAENYGKLNDHVEANGGSFYFVGLPEQRVYFEEKFPDYLNNHEAEAQTADALFIQALEDQGVHRGADAVSGNLLHVRHPCGIQRRPAGGLQGQRDGVIGPVLRQSGGLEELFLCIGFLGVDGGDGEGAPGQGAGLVKDHGLRMGQGLQIVAALDQDAAPAGAADAAEKAQRHGDHQGAGAGDHQEYERPVEPVLPDGAREEARQGAGVQKGQGQRRQREQQRRGDHHAGSVVPGEAGDEVLAGGFFLAGVFHQVQNLGDGGLLAAAGDLHPQKARLVDAAADDDVAGHHVPGHGFSGEGGGVQGGSALQHLSVQGDPLAGLDDDHVPHRHVLRVHLLNGTVLRFQVGGVGADVHQGGDGLAGLAHGVVLEQLSHLVEEHHEHRLAVLPGAEGAHGGQGHEEILVKDLAVCDVADGPPYDVPADDEVGDEIQRPRRQRPGPLPCPADGKQGDGGGQRDGGQQFHHEQQHRRKENAAEHFFLFFRHIGSSEIRGRSPSGPKTPLDLQMDHAVGLHLFAHGHHLAHDVVKPGLVGVNGHFLGEEADGGVADAVDLFDGRLHFGGAVGTVQVGEFETLFHDRFLLLSIKFVLARVTRRHAPDPGQ